MQQHSSAWCPLSTEQQHRWGCTFGAGFPFSDGVCVCVNERRNKTICLGTPGMDSREVFVGNVKIVTGALFSIRVCGVGLCFKEAAVAQSK